VQALITGMARYEELRSDVMSARQATDHTFARVVRAIDEANQEASEAFIEEEAQEAAAAQARAAAAAQAHVAAARAQAAAVAQAQAVTARARAEEEAWRAANPAAAQVMEVCGPISRADAERALTASHGSVQAAINLLLGG
jgi:hypothetical protein